MGPGRTSRAWYFHSPATPRIVRYLLDQLGVGVTYLAPELVMPKL